MNRLLIASMLVLAACGPADYSLSSSALSTGANDEGTRLSVATGEAAVSCDADGLGASVSLSYTVSSIAAADSAVVTASVDAGDELQIGAIASGTAGWTFDGRTKTATGVASFSLDNGDHTLVICVTQSGANGRLPKRTCSALVNVKVDCEQSDEKSHCNQGVGNGAEGCDPGNSNNHNGSNDENGGIPGRPGRGRRM